ncbi:MAG: BON domain-containing protein [Proteobacteria bacterium]|nr:MAG: BON domain-containing protein [Pseudomonadota bacterium]
MISNTNRATVGRSRRALAACVLLAMYLGGCAVATVGTVLVTGVDIARDRRTVGTYVDDNAVEIKIRRALRQDSQFGPNTHISVTSMNGIVLLTGEVVQHEQSRRAAGIARGYTEARQVINQLTIEPVAGFTSRTRDSWITTKSKSALLTAPGVSAGRVKIVTEGATVYLLGMVSRAEADAAVNAIRKIRGVQRIVKVFEYI